MKKEEFISVIALPFFLICFVDLFYYITQFGGIIYYSSFTPLFISLLIFFSVYGILVGTFKQTKIPLSILMITTGFFSVLNEIKIYYTNEPIVLSDLFFLSSMGEITNLIKTTLGATILNYLSHICCVIIISICFIFIANKNNLKIKNKKISKSIFALSTIILLVLFVPLDITRNIMLNNVFKMDERQVWLQKTGLIAEYGVIAGMYEQLLENRISKPEGYDDEKLEMILENVHNQESVSSAQKPNVILVFSESFWDISQLIDVKFDKEVTSNFNSLKDKGQFINIISPAYGGMSANVEFELFTGANTCYFNTGYIPYLQLYTDKYKVNESIIKQIEINGYITKIVTANSDKLYNCKDAYQKLEIEETEFLGSDEKHEAIKGFFISDEYMTQKVIEDFEEKPLNKPIFYMIQTMQAHMPYPIEKYKQYDIKLEKSDYDAEINDSLLSYAQGVYDADVQLGRLYDYINTYTEPTILVFFGDHLPPLTRDNGDDIIDEIGYFNTGDVNVDIYRRYNTQALILANYDISDFEDVDFLGYDLLLSYLIKNVGLKMSDYYNWLYTTKDVLAANNHYISIDNKGTIYNLKEMTKQMKEIYDLKEKMQYKFFIEQ